MLDEYRPGGYPALLCHVHYPNSRDVCNSCWASLAKGLPTRTLDTEGHYGLEIFPVVVNNNQNGPLSPKPDHINQYYYIPGHQRRPSSASRSSARKLRGLLQDHGAHFYRLEEDAVYKFHGIQAHEHRHRISCNLPEDRPEPMLIVLNIIHSRFSLVPEKLTLSELYNSSSLPRNMMSLK